MRIRFLSVALMVLVGASASEASEGIVSYVPGIGGYVNGTAGWTFQPLVNISATSLGCFDSAIGFTNQETMLIGLWADDGTLLASKTVTATSPLIDQTRYEPITPVLLTSGLTYHLGAYAPATGTIILEVAAPGSDVGGSVTTSPEIQIGAAVAHFFEFGFPDSLQAGPGSAFLVPNFQFTPVPEPSAMALAVISGLVIARRRARLPVALR